jgi:transcriptional regulator with XRE-family HTH domain
VGWDGQKNFVRLGVMRGGVNMSVHYSLIGQRIAAKRKLMELTQAELAERASLSTKYISKIESSTNRALTIKSVLQICKALDVSPTYLLLGTEDDNPDAGYTNVCQLMKLCDARQLRQVMQFINAILTE